MMTKLEIILHYHIASNKRWGHSFNFINLLQNTERVTILYINVNGFVVFFYPKNSIIIFVNHICNTPIPVLVQIVEEE